MLSSECWEGAFLRMEPIIFNLLRIVRSVRVGENGDFSEERSSRRESLLARSDIGGVTAAILESLFSLDKFKCIGESGCHLLCCIHTQNLLSLAASQGGTDNFRSGNSTGNHWTEMLNMLLDFIDNIMVGLLLNGFILR